MFWIEHVPLNGTSQISLQATDASGTKRVTNSFTVYPSDIILTIASTPTGDALYAGTGPVTGTVSDPNAVVTVNGITATVADHYWSAEHVPIYGRGTATFDATAISGGASLAGLVQPRALMAGMSTPTAPSPASANASVTKEMDAKWIYSYHQVTETDVANYSQGNCWNYSWSKVYFSALKPDNDGNWQQMYSAFGLEQSDEVLDGYSNYYYSLYLWSHLDPVGTVTTIDSFGLHDPEPIVEDEAWKPKSVPQADLIGYISSGTMWYYCVYAAHYYADKVEGVYPGTGGRHKKTVNAVTTAKLYTGGKAKVARQSLFGIKVEAGEYPKLLEIWQWVPSTTIAPNKLEVLGKHPGADGKLWVALPDNSEQDITVHTRRVSNTSMPQPRRRNTGWLSRPKEWPWNQMRWWMGQNFAWGRTCRLSWPSCPTEWRPTTLNGR